MPKNRFSTYRLIAGHLCGAYGKALMDDGPEVQIEENYAMKLGKQAEEKAFAYLSGLDDVSDDWKKILPDPGDVVQLDVDWGKNDGLKKQVDGIDLICKPDIIDNKNQCWDIKFGRNKDWHKLQVQIQLFMSGGESGGIINLKTGQKIEVKGAVDEDWIRGVFNNVFERETSKCELCEFCPLKQGCKEWVQPKDKVPKEAIDFVIAEQEVKHQKSKLAKFIGEHEKILTELDSIKSDIKDAEKNTETAKAIAKKKLDLKKYPTNFGVVSITERNFKDLPDNYLELRPPEQHPHLYKIEPKKTDLKKEIGIDVPIRVIEIKR